MKKLLFLGAGSVIMGLHHNQDIRWMGNVRKYMPITWITSLIGTLALVGTPFFAGFYSKDSIIEAVHFSNLPAAHWAYFAVLAGVFVTSFYSFRLYFLVFHGKERFDKNPDAHHGHGAHHDDHHGAAKPHETPWVVTVPLVLLAIPSVIIGFFTIDPMLIGGFFKGAIHINTELHPAMETFREEFHGAVAMAMHGFTTLPFWLALGGAVSAWYMYLINPALPAALERFFNAIGVLNILDNKYYLDWLNENVLARGARLLGTGLWKGGDAGLIDGLIVGGSVRVVNVLAALVRYFQSGHIYHYAFTMIFGVCALLSFWLLHA